MKTTALSLAALLIFSGCTYNQEARIRELLTVQQGAFPKAKDANIVAESLSHPSDTFILEMIPSDPLETPKGALPVWILRADKLPLEERFIFASIEKVTGKIDPQYEFELMEDGRLKIFGKSGIRYESEIPFAETRPFPSASPFQYVIVSKKTQKSAVAEFTPHPVQTYGERGEALFLEVTHPMGTHFQLTAKGFEPNEAATLVHKTGDQIEELKIQADEKGFFSIGLNPTLFGRLGGEAEITVMTESGDISLTYPWGARLDKIGFEDKSAIPVLFVANRLPEEIVPERVQEAFYASLFKKKIGSMIE